MEKAVRLDKDNRRVRMAEMLCRDPGKTDQWLADFFGVSVATIRLDRRMMGIPQLRDRLEAAVQDAAEESHEIEILELDRGERGLGIVQTTSEMAGPSGLIPAEKLYGIAAELAKAVVGQPFAEAQVGNIKYKMPARSGMRLVVKAKMAHMRGSRQYMYVQITAKEKEIFRAKFIMNVIGEEPHQAASL